MFLPTEPTEIDFIFKKCDAPRLSLTYWRSVPEFFEKIKGVSATSKTIGNTLIFNTMLEIYRAKEKSKYKGLTVDFNFQLARRSLTRLSEVLFNDKNALKNK